MGAKQACLGQARARGGAKVFGEALDVGGVARERLLAGLRGKGLWSTEFFHACLKAEVHSVRLLFLDVLLDREPWAESCYWAWYHPPVRRLCLGILKDDQDADDVAQSVCSKFLLGQPVDPRRGDEDKEGDEESEEPQQQDQDIHAEVVEELQAQGDLENPQIPFLKREAARRTFPGYLFTMARNASRRAFNKRKARREGRSELGRMVGDDELGERPDERISREQLARVIRECMEAALTEEQRDLLEQRYWEEKKLKDIDTSAQNAKQKIRRAEAKLGECVGKKIDRLTFCQRLQVAAAGAAGSLSDAQRRRISSLYPPSVAKAKDRGVFPVASEEELADLETLCAQVARRVGRPMDRRSAVEWKGLVDEAVAALTKNQLEALRERYVQAAPGDERGSYTKSAKTLLDNTLKKLWKHFAKRLRHTGGRR